MIYTLGYQFLTPERVREIVFALDAVLLDCRFKPVSRIPGFGGRQLESLMRPRTGDPGEDDGQARYLRMGEQLGGRGHTTRSGLKSLKPFADELANCVLLCKEEHPIDCHRHRDITGPHYPEAMHIYGDRLFYSRELSRVQEGEISFPDLRSGSWNDWMNALTAGRTSLSSRTTPMTKVRL